MDRLLALIPPWVPLAAMGLLAGLLGVQTVRLAWAQTELAEYKADVAENTRKAEVQARAKEKSMRDSADRIANEQAAKESELALSDEEIKIIASESLKGGVLDSLETEIIKNAVDFSDTAALTRLANELFAALPGEHPKLGAVSPAEFVPIAEESGAIVAIGAWVMRQACAQWAAWQREAPERAPRTTLPGSVPVGWSSRRITLPLTTVAT